MIQLQQNRYLWVHFAALALVPLLLDVCLVGLASARAAFGYPNAYGVQFWAIAILCIGPPLWMQIARPFYIFSLPPVALNPSRLTEDQKRCLTVLTSWQIKALAGVVAVGCIGLLAQLYEKAALVTNPTIPLMTPTAGMVSAVVTFFWVSVFVQISVSAGRSLLVSPTALKRVTPYEGAIAQNFLIAGVRVSRLLKNRPEPSLTPENLSLEDLQSEDIAPEDLSPKDLISENLQSEDLTPEDSTDSAAEIDLEMKNGGQ